MSAPDPPDHEGFPARLRDIAGTTVAPTLLLAGLLFVAVLYTLYFARAVLLPLVLAILLAMILMPAVRALHRMRLPRGLGAAIVVATLAGSLGVLAAWVYEPATQWIETAPSTLAEAERKLRDF